MSIEEKDIVPRKKNDPRKGEKNRTERENMCIPAGGYTKAKHHTLVTYWFFSHSSLTFADITSFSLTHARFFASVLLAIFSLPSAPFSMLSNI